MAVPYIIPVGVFGPLPDITAAAGYDTIEMDGTALTQRSTLNIRGLEADLEAQDDGVSKTLLSMSQQYDSLFYEDFIGGLTNGNGTLGSRKWSKTNLGTSGLSSANNVAGQTGRPGIVEMVTSATNGRGGSIHVGNSTRGVIVQTGLVIAFAFRPTVTPTSNKWRIGLTSAIADPPTDGLYVEGVTSTNANWRLVHRKASADDGTLASSIAVANGTWRRFMIVVESTTVARLYIDGTSEGTITAASWTTTAIGPAVHAICAGSGASATCQTDYFCMAYDPLIAER